MKTPQCPICKGENCAEFKLGISDGFCWQTDPRNRVLKHNKKACYRKGYQLGKDEIEQAADDAFQAQYSFHNGER